MGKIVNAYITQCIPFIEYQPRFNLEPIESFKTTSSIIEELKLEANTDIGPKDIFEMASNVGNSALQLCQEIS